jgi:hypothetical protein
LPATLYWADRRQVLVWIVTLLYLVLGVLDLCGKQNLSRTVKYLAIWLCFLLSFTNPPNRTARLLTTALFFTVLADSFLLNPNGIYIVGIACFGVVQGIYLVFLWQKTGHTFWPVRCLAAIGICFLPAVSLLARFSCVYFSQLFLNACQSMGCRNQPGGRLFSNGLWLFCLCDICVALSNLGNFLPRCIVYWAGVYIWLFYLPSQLLIVFSAAAGTTTKGEP